LLLTALAALFTPAGLALYATVLMPAGLVMARRRGRQIAALVMPILVIAPAVVATTVIIIAARVIAIIVMPVVPWHHIHRLTRHMVIGGRIMAVIAAMAIATATVYRTTGQGQPQQRDNHGFKQHAGLRTASG